MPEDAEWLARFDLETYGRLLARLTRERANLCFRDLRGADQVPAGSFLLRHDIDLCPEAALRMACFEQERGVRATYFLLPGAADYNLFAPECAALPATLAGLGHEVGLHYDVRALEAAAAGGELEAVLEAQAAVLGVMAGRPIESIAMHNPSVSGADPFRQARRFLNAYDPRFAGDIVYLSDSCGAWRDAAVAALAAGDLPDRLQLLVHPFFWDTDGADRWTRLTAFMARRREGLREREAEMRAGWQAHAGVGEHEARAARSARAAGHGRADRR